MQSNNEKDSKTCQLSTQKILDDLKRLRVLPIDVDNEKACAQVAESDKAVIYLKAQSGRYFHGSIIPKKLAQSTLEEMSTTNTDTPTWKAKLVDTNKFCLYRMTTLLQAELKALKEHPEIEKKLLEQINPFTCTRHFVP